MTEDSFPERDMQEYGSVFEGMLNPREKLVWTGRPRQGTFLMPLNPKSTLVTGLAAIFSLLFAVLAGLLVYNFLYRVIGAGMGLLFFVMCAYATFNQVGGGFLARQKTYYALTNRRALALYRHNVPAIVSKEYDYSAGSIQLRLTRGGRGTILFGEATLTYFGMEHVRGGTKAFELKFEDIANAYAVYDQICSQSPQYRTTPVA